MSVLKNRLCFLTAVLYLIFISRKTLIQVRFAQDAITVNTNSAQLPHILQECYNKLVQVEKDLFHHGHKNYSAEILLECANLHR